VTFFERRSCISVRLLTCLLFLTLSLHAAQGSSYLVYVGTYTDTGSEGIYVYRYDAESGRIEPLGVAAKAVNPSFLVVHPSRRIVYAVNETVTYEGKPTGAVSAFSIAPGSGELTLLNRVESRGADPCYVSLDRTGKYVLVANYTGGSVASFPILDDGRLGDAASFVQHQGGKGADPQRQDGPHAHSIDLSPDNRHAIVADLGLDQLLIYNFDANSGALSAGIPPYTKVSRGAGPRHLTFHPSGTFAYAVNELHSTVSTFGYDAGSGTLEHLQTVSMLPARYVGRKEAAEIHVHPSGRFLYASNRGHDSIAVFKIDRKKGTLTKIQRIHTGGKEPRFFGFDPTGVRLFAANQNSNSIIVFNVDTATGRLTATSQRIDVPSPVAISFVKEQ